MLCGKSILLVADNTLLISGTNLMNSQEKRKVKLYSSQGTWYINMCVCVLAIKHNIVFSIKINFQSFHFLYSTSSIRYDFTDVPLPPLCIEYSNDRTINTVRREGTENCPLYCMAIGNNDGTCWFRYNIIDSQDRSFRFDTKQHPL